MVENFSEQPIDFRSKNRLKLVFIFFLFMFSLVLARLFYVQIINAEKYRKLAELQHLKKVEVKAKRGEIFDRNGTLLASTISARSFAVDPAIVRKDSLAVKELFTFCSLLGFSVDKVQQILNSNRRFVWLKRGLFEYTNELDTFDFSGLITISEPKRIQLYGSEISNLLGLVNLDNEGISGLELSLDSVLRGKDGFVYYLKDARGRLLPALELPSKQAIDGKNIRITVDIDLQRIVSYFLEKGVEENGAKGGCVIAINPSNGEILALASYLSFNPNSTNPIDNSNLFFYPTNFGFEPGSTIKPIIAAIALSRGFVDENTLFNGYGGKFVYGDITIVDEHPFQRLTLRDALVYSSNIAFAQIASLIPFDILTEELVKLGFGKKTEIPLPGELKGYVKKGENFGLTQQMYWGFGYGMFVTPLQVALAFAALANGGYLVEPKLLVSNKVDTTKIRIFDTGVVEKLKKYLIEVVDEGTAVATKINGIEIAGKTGTSQKFLQGAYSKSSYINTFIGFLPAKNPKILFLVLLDEPKKSIYAGSTVVPIFRNIVLSILNSELVKYAY
ncbi:MAG: peptidoglycan D,D-transpeptidase FtsI family protein [Candidatus Kapaibacteriota bacterium]